MESHLTMSTIRLAILGSTRGTSMQALIEAINAKKLSAQIEIVVSNRADAGILTRAESFGLNTCCLESKNLSRQRYDDHLNAILSLLPIDLIVLIGFMRILSAPFVERWRNKIINVHPSLLPKHKGLMDLAVHESVLASSDKLSGCSVHYVTQSVDGGQILMQKTCQVEKTDTVFSLKEKVQALESVALIEAIRDFKIVFANMPC